MPDITMPDGQVVRFPDTMTETQIRGLIASKYPREVAQATLARPASEREQPSGMAARHPFANAPISQAEAYGFGAADTGAFAAGDEAGAGIASLLTDVPYSEALEETRALDTAAREQHPNSYLTGQVGGGLAQAIATRGRGIMPNATSLGGRVLGGALTGGTYGGLHGAGSGTDPESRGALAVSEGILGAAIGGAFPLITQGLSSGYGAIRDAISSRAASTASGHSADALRVVGDVMDADGTLGAQGRANMAAAGPDAMIVDAGPNARQLLDQAIQRGGPGATQAREAVAARTGRAAQDVNAALDDTLGRPQGVTATRDAIRQSTAGARGNAYDVAYSRPIDYASPNGRLLEQMVKGRVPGDVIRQANRLMQLDGDQSQQILARIADDGTVTFERMPDVKQIDYITRALNTMAQSGEGQGNLGGQTTLGRAYENLALNIRNVLRREVPEYGNALDTAADPIRRSQAVDLGSRLLSPSMTRDQVESAISGMSKAEKEALAQGVRSRIDDMMANVSRTVQDGDVPAREAIKALREMSTRSNREKMTMVLGRQGAEDLFGRLDRAARTFDLRASVADNSKTYTRLAAEKAAKARTQPGPVDRLLEGKPLESTKRLMQMFTGRTPENMTRQEDALYSELASLLTNPVNPRVVSAIDQLRSSDIANRLMQERIYSGVSGGVYPAIPLSRRAQEEIRR